jgi:hypothetical protein
MSEAIPPLPNTPSWRGAQLKHRDNFNFTFTFTFTFLRTLYVPLFCYNIYGYFPAILREVCSALLSIQTNSGVSRQVHATIACAQSAANSSSIVVLSLDA